MVFLNFLEDLDLVKSSFHVVWTAFLNLYGNISVELKVFAEPDSRKVTPAQFLNYDVPIYKCLADMYRVVTAYFVVFYSLVLRVVILVKFL